MTQSCACVSMATVLIFLHTHDALMCHFRKRMYLPRGDGSCALVSLMYSWYNFMHQLACSTYITINYVCICICDEQYRIVQNTPHSIEGTCCIHFFAHSLKCVYPISCTPVCLCSMQTPLKELRVALCCPGSWPCMEATCPDMT